MVVTRSFRPWVHGVGSAQAKERCLDCFCSWRGRARVEGLWWGHVWSFECPPVEIEPEGGHARYINVPRLFLNTDAPVVEV